MFIFDVQDVWLKLTNWLPNFRAIIASLIDITLYNKQNLSS